MAVGEHDYYHLLSGTDLPLRPIRKVNAFFSASEQREFVNFEDPSRYSRQYELRLKYRHYFRERCGRNKNAYTAFNKGLWLFQKAAHMSNKNTIPEPEFVFGSNWFDITEGLARHVLDNEGVIRGQYANTSNADEVFLQHLVWNSGWRGRLWRDELDNGMEGNMRYINWKGSVNAGPRTIDDDLVEEALSSGMMFARKFDYERYPEAVERVLGSL